MTHKSKQQKLTLTAISTLTRQKETLLFDVALEQEGAHDLEHVISHFVTAVIATNMKFLMFAVASSIKGILLRDIQYHKK
jgi:hypothetical protein